MKNYAPSWINRNHNFDKYSNIVFPLGRIVDGGLNIVGTAFLLPKAGLVATASHCVGLSDEGLVLILCGMKDLNDYQDTSVAAYRVINLKLISQDPVHDLAILQTPQPFCSGLKIASSDEAPVGTELVTLGYPHADYGRAVLTRYDSSVGARVLLASPRLNVKYLVINSMARPGQSGSPVFRKDDGRLVAIIIGAYVPEGGVGVVFGNFDPAALHQTTHAVSAEYLLEML